MLLKVIMGRQVRRVMWEPKGEWGRESKQVGLGAGGHEGTEPNFAGAAPEYVGAFAGGRVSRGDGFPPVATGGVRIETRNSGAKGVVGSNLQAGARVRSRHRLGQDTDNWLIPACH